MIALHPNPLHDLDPSPADSLTKQREFQVFTPIATCHNDWICNIASEKKGIFRSGGVAYHCPHYPTGSKTPTHSTFALTQALERNISVRLVGKQGKIGRSGRENITRYMRLCFVCKDTFITIVARGIVMLMRPLDNAGPAFGLRNDRS